MPTFYVAWVAEGTAFNAGTHATAATKIWDGTSGSEFVFSLELSQEEGNFASLKAEIINPKVGLLSAGRNQWIWLSWDNGSGVEALFNGRLVGVPSRLHDEVLEVEFIARPADWIDLKAALAETLRVLPWHDEVWIAQGQDSDDAVLETRAALYHVDRVTLAVTTSDIIEGEDGTIDVGEADHLYDDMDVAYGDAPLKKITITGTVTWDQVGSGDIDLTHELVSAFLAAGSPYPYPCISSLTGPGLFDDWPVAESEIGGGWSIGADSTISEATFQRSGAYVVHYVDKSQDNTTRFADTSLQASDVVFTDWTNWEASFELKPYAVHLTVHYDADRKRTEIVTATVEADVQAILVDPDGTDEDTIELSSDFVGQEVGSEESPTQLPIDDVRRNSYFKTDRGAQSFEYLLLLARAKLLARARAVKVTITLPGWDIGVGFSCRKNIRLVDYRMPEGAVTGKITKYTLSIDGDSGELKSEAELGCTIGYGISLSAAAAGTGVYCNDNYADGYQAHTGAETDLLPGELKYQSFDDFAVTDDDGLDLFNMNARDVINALTVANGPTAQRAAIDAVLHLPEPDPGAALKDAATIITLDLKPVDGGPFTVTFNPTVSRLVVPQTVNLEAA